jgi:hypothetical protein
MPTTRYYVILLKPILERNRESSLKMIANSALEDRNIGVSIHGVAYANLVTYLNFCV